MRPSRRSSTHRAPVRVLEPNAALVEEVCRVLASAGDPERAEAQQRYMKSAMPFHGIGAAQLRAILRPVLAHPAYRIDRREEWEATVRVLWDAATHREIRYAAIALAGHRAYRQWQDPQALGLYEHLITTGAWWDLVDVVAANRVGPILRGYPAQTTPHVREWAVSEDIWLRRAAIVSQLGAKASTDVGLLEECLAANLEGSRFGSEFWIRKAVGWALRQHARTDPDWVRQAVARYGNRLSGLSRREALKHVSASDDPPS